jgi:hypothetical protein
VAFGFDEGPDFFDFAGLADEEGTAGDAHESTAHELFFLPGAELFDRFVVWIAEQGKVEFFIFLERGLGFDGIGTHAEDCNVELVEFFLCVTKLGRFDGSTGGVGFGIEKEEDALALEINQGDKFVIIRFETEVGSFGTDFQHRFTSLFEANSKEKISGPESLPDDSKNSSSAAKAGR